MPYHTGGPTNVSRCPALCFDGEVPGFLMHPDLDLPTVQHLCFFIENSQVRQNCYGVGRCPQKTAPKTFPLPKPDLNKKNNKTTPGPPEFNENPLLRMPRK